MESITRRCGAWNVQHTWGSREVLAWRRDESLTYSAPVAHFPIGTRVGKWSPCDPPASAQRMARVLVREVEGR